MIPMATTSAPGISNTSITLPYSRSASSVSRKIAFESCCEISIIRHLAKFVKSPTSFKRCLLELVAIKSTIIRNWQHFPRHDALQTILGAVRDLTTDSWIANHQVLPHTHKLDIFIQLSS